MSNYLNNHGSSSKASNLKQSYEKRAGKFSLLFANYLPESFNSQIVDLGCSTGQIVGWLQSIGYKNASGVDSDFDSISFGLKAGINNLYVDNVFEHLESFKDESIDLFILRDITEHFSKKDFEKLLTSLEKKLKFNGFVWIQTPNAISPASNFMMYGDWTHESLVSPTSIRQLISHYTNLTIDELRGEHINKLGLKKLHLFIFRGLINYIYKFYFSTLTSLNSKEIIVEPNLVIVLKKQRA